MRTGNDAAPNRRKRTAARIAAYPACAIALAVVVLAFVPGSAVTPFEQRDLLFLLNTLCLSAASALLAGLAMFGYLRSGRGGLLAAGCGVLASGLAALFAAVTAAHDGTPNAFVTIHNLGVLLASVMHLSAAVTAVQPRPPPAQITGRPQPPTSVFLASCCCSRPAAGPESSPYSFSREKA